jgi:hypothetical protein
MLIKYKAAPVGRQRPKRGIDFYSGVLRTQPKVVDVYQRAGGLGELAGQTGIPAIDLVLDSAEAKADQATLALKLNLAASAASLAVSLLLLYRSLR